MSLETLTEKNLHNMTYLSENLSNLEKVYNESFSKYNIAPRVDQVEKKIERLNEILTKDIPTKINNIREKSGLGEDLDDSQRWENPPDLRIQSDKDIKAGYKKNKKKKARKAKVNLETEVPEEGDSTPEELAEEATKGLVRARNDKGHYVKDDPTTPQNEAWVKKK